MSKKILGDNPFSTDEPGDAAAPDSNPAISEQADARSAHLASAGDGRHAGQPSIHAGPGSDAEPDADSAADDGAAPEPADLYDGGPDAGSDTESVPDAPATQPLDYFDAAAMDYLGLEATVPQGDYGPPISSNFPPPGVTREMRELTDRMEVYFTPAVPIEHRRRMPQGPVWRRYRQFAMRNRSPLVDEFGRDPVYMAQFEPILDFLYKLYFRVETSGMHHVPDTGRALLVANHAGTLPWDAALITYAMRREHPARRDARPLVEDFVFHSPYLGTFINRIGGVRACPENAQMLLEQDHVVVVFPEGIKGVGKLYRDRYKLQRFGRGGFIKLALRTGAPIIPVAMIGGEDTNPMLGKVTWLARSLGVPHLPITPTFPWLGPLGLMPLPAKWHIRFGAPIDVASEHGPDAADDRILVNRLADSVRSTIQGMIDQTLVERRPSPWSAYLAR